MNAPPTTVKTSVCARFERGQSDRIPRRVRDRPADPRLRVRPSEAELPVSFVSAAVMVGGSVSSGPGWKPMTASAVSPAFSHAAMVALPITLSPLAMG